MDWNILAICLLMIAVIAFSVGSTTERASWRDSNRALRKEIAKQYREIENLREIIFHYEETSSRHLGNPTAKGHR
jgi:hypothetical protein